MQIKPVIIYFSFCQSLTPWCWCCRLYGSTGGCTRVTASTSAQVTIATTRRERRSDIGHLELVRERAVRVRVSICWIVPVAGSIRADTCHNVILWKSKKSVWVKETTFIPTWTPIVGDMFYIIIIITFKGGMSSFLSIPKSLLIKLDPVVYLLRYHFIKVLKWYS